MKPKLRTETGDAGTLGERYLNIPDDMVFKTDTDAIVRSSARRMQKLGGVACFLMAVAFLVAPYIYLVGDLRLALGPLAYDLADFLYGPVWAASLVVMFFALRERIGGLASRRMSLALLAALLAAGAMVLVACIRSANRHYHLIHPELHLEESATVLLVWTTLVAGVTGAGWHFLGWALVLVGWSGWTSDRRTSVRLPRLLSGLYVVAGVISLFVYLQPELEGGGVLLGVVVCIWQGILLWRAKPDEMQAIEIGASHDDQA